MPAKTLKIHGGKAYLAARIRSLFRPHKVYIEPYFGGGSVLLAGTGEGVSEIVNDRNLHLVTFWRVLRDPKTFPQLVRLCEATPFGAFAFRDAQAVLSRVNGGWAAEPAAWAWATLVLGRQSLGGRGKDFPPQTGRTRRGMNEHTSAWLTAVDGLPGVHARLRRVAILPPQDALTVIEKHDGPETLFYLDPPYHPDAVGDAGKTYGAFACDREHHARLLAALANLRGAFALSGYRCAAYDEAAKVCRWRRADFDLPNQAAGGKSKKRMTESVWTNYDPPAVRGLKVVRC